MELNYFDNHTIQIWILSSLLLISIVTSIVFAIRFSIVIKKHNQLVSERQLYTVSKPEILNYSHVNNCFKVLSLKEGVVLLEKIDNRFFSGGDNLLIWFNTANIPNKCLSKGTIFKILNFDYPEELIFKIISKGKF